MAVQSIQHNISAMNAQRNMNVAKGSVSKAQEKLSTGFRINRSADDAAGLAISQKMRAQIRGLNQASRNASDGISLIQTAEGALATTHDILERLDELATQSANGTYTDKTDRDAIQLEVDQLLKDIDRIATDTEFNTMKLLNGNLSAKTSSNGGTIAGADPTKAIITGLSTGAICSAGASYVLSTGASFCIDLGGCSITITGSTLDVIRTQIMGSAAGGTGASQLNVLLKALNEAVNQKITSSIGSGKVTIDFSINDKGQVTLTANAIGDFSGNISFSGTLAEDLGLDKSVVVSGKAGAAAAEKVAGDGKDIKSLLGSSVLSTLSQSKLIFEIGDKKVEITGLGGFQLSATASTMGSCIATCASFMSKLQSAITTALGSASLSNFNISLSLNDEGKMQLRIVADNLKEEVTIKISGSIADYFGISDEGFSLSPAGVTTTTQTDGGMTLHVGANENQIINFDINDMGTKALGVDKLNLSTQDSAEKAITTVQDAINKVSMERAKLGAVQNRLDYAITNLDTTSENLTSSEAQIRDADMASEVLKQTQYNVLQQAAQSMLAQANQQPQMVLQLLG